MTYTHITTDELVMIEAYFHQETPTSHIAKLIGRARQTVHNVIAYLRDGHTALDYYQRYKENKKRCGRKGLSCRPTSRSMLKRRWRRAGHRMSSPVGRKYRLTARAVHCFGCSNGKLLMRPHCRCKASENQTDIRNVEAVRHSGATFQKEQMTTRRSMMNLVIWRGTPSSVCDTKVPLSRWLNASQKPSSP